MRPVAVRSIAASLVLGGSLVQAAINVNGSRVIAPLTKDDPSPIDDPTTYKPDQHACPLICKDYSNQHSWIPYNSADRLHRCKEPMLLGFSVNQPLDDPTTRVLIRACTVEGSGKARRAIAVESTEAAAAAPMANPKKDKTLYDDRLDAALACSAAGSEVEASLEVAVAAGGREKVDGIEAGDVVVLLAGMQKFFEDKDNCDENFLFARHKDTVASIYIGDNLGKATVESAIEALTSRIAKDTASPSKSLVAQLCGNGTLAEGGFGIAIDTTGDLDVVQKIAREWSYGECASDAKLQSAGDRVSVKVFKIVDEPRATPETTLSNSTATNTSGSGSVETTTELNTPESGGPVVESDNPGSNSTASNNTQAATTQSAGTESASSESKSGESTGAEPAGIRGSRIMRRNKYNSRSLPLQKRATCRTHEVKFGQDCPKLASVCGVSPDDFTKFNSFRKDMCATLREGDIVCCSAGDPPPKPEPPKKNADGTCASHLIAKGDTCASLATKFGVTDKDLEKWNAGKTWAWTDCPGMMEGYTMCISDGLPPMPAPQEGVACGPMVKDTKRPSDPNTSLADLNPCPLKACCSNWGFCGPFEQHCAVHTPKGAGPGATEKGFQNTCISNCGQDIKKNSEAPKQFSRIGYYESYNLERECLHLHAKNANTDGSYTHLHWAFAEIDPQTWKPVIKDPNGQWKDFKSLPVKRILSFGGWAYSTESATFNIIRQAILTNHETFVSRLVEFANNEGIDGIDIDLEYPGAPDIFANGQAIGQKGDGAAYLRFLTTLKQKLGPEKSVSIAAPASYWYLKAFPIDSMAQVIDYIVYMTYDLHGQWDYDNPNAYENCDSGKCIRSHVNLTETRNSLSIITKAGVPNNKIFVGEASYGRSFHMAKDGCWEPMCEFTGARNKSDAHPGRCTKEGGYLAYAEIDEIISKGEGKTLHDGGSNTDILLYKGDYVAYTTPKTKETRRSDWKKLNFAGTVDWAVDLQSFTRDDLDAVDPNDTCDKYKPVFSNENMPQGSFTPSWATAPENAAHSGKQYITIVNLTPYRFVKTYQHSYQFDAFDFDDIPSGKARQNTMHYTEKVVGNEVDTNGEAYYQLEGTNKKFEIRGTTHIPDNYPRRTVVDLTGMGLGQREYNDPEQEVPVTLVITGSEEYGYIASHKFGANNWMHELHDVIGDRQLRHVVMPGSHDAGMSMIGDSLKEGWNALGTSSNSQNQDLNIYDQLRVGSRYFDLRVASAYGGPFFAAHVNDEKSKTPVGATGEKLDDIIAGINKFMAESPGEVVILWVKYMVDLNSNVPAGAGRYWDEKKTQSFYSKMEGIKNRCTNLPDKKFDRLPAKTFMDQNNGGGCVLIITDGTLSDGISQDKPSSGIYYKSHMDRDDHWAEKETVEDLAKNQVDHMLSKKRTNADDSSADPFLIMQWLVTPDALTSTLDTSLGIFAMMYSNPALYWNAFNAMSPDYWPTVIMQDYVGLVLNKENKFPSDLSAELRVLCMGLNLYMVSQNCKVSKRGNPLLKKQGGLQPALAAGLAVNSNRLHQHSNATSAARPFPMKFHGVVYANGTIDEAPRPKFHLGRCKTLKAGTIFMNGTKLEVDTPNPDFDAEF